MERVFESLEIHDNLNKILFDKDMNLKDEIRERLLKIADTFVDDLPMTVKVLDIQLVGSNASYNYTKQSDIDLHIIVDFESVDASEEILRALFNYNKDNFKRKYNVTLKGQEVEVYVQDINATVTSNGIYSVKRNKWIKKPVKIEIEFPDISKELEKWENKIDKAIKSGNIDKMKNIVDELKLTRRDSIDTDGEYSVFNLVFKELRNNEYISKLKDAINKLMGRDLTLESLMLL